MMNRNCSRNGALLVSAALTLAAANSGLAALYSVKDLGALVNLSGRTDSMAYGINNLGQVVAANVTGGAYRAFLYSGAWTNLGTLGGGESLAYGISDAGQVIGRSITAAGQTHAFVWTAGSTNGVPTNPQMKDLGTLGGNNSEAYGANQAGQIAGFAETTTDARAFLYSEDTMTDIGKLLGNSLRNSFGYSINAAGHIAGAAYNSSYSTPHAFYYNGNTAVDIGNLGGKGSTALAINNRDSVVGYIATAASFDHAFQYVGGVMTDLGTLGGNYSYAFAINNSNVIVGGSFTNSSDTVYHAFVLQGGSMTDLNLQLASSGAGWVLAEARGINDVGQIVGTGTYRGASHIFLLTPVTGVAAPTIVSTKVSGSNVLISFTTANLASYSLLTRPELATGSWATLVSGIVGTGGIMTVTNSGGATLLKRFYRVSATP
jgi:probable HAF family extracellular repeat protein